MSYRVAVVGATGAVGTVMLRQAARARLPGARDRPVRLRALGGPRARRRDRASALARRDHPGLRPRAVQRRRDDLGRVGAALRRGRRGRRRQLLARGAATPRSRSSSPRSTREALDGHQGLIANPNCSTMQLMVALKPIHDAAGIERLIVSTYQSVSGTGVKAVERARGPDARRRCTAMALPARRRSTRTRSRSTCSAAPATSPTATTTPTKSAR